MLRVLSILVLPFLLLSVVASASSPTQIDLANLQTITSENVSQLRELARIGNGTIYEIAWSPDGRRLAAAGSLGVWVFDSLIAPPRLLEGHTGVVNSVAFSPDGKIIASGSSDRTIRLWDVETGETVSVFEGHTNDVLSLAFSPDGKLLASGDRDNFLRIWDVEDRQELKYFQDKVGLTDSAQAITAIDFSPDSHAVAWGTSKQTDLNGGFLWLWNLTQRQPQSLMEVPRISSVSFTADGSQIFADTFLSPPIIWDIQHSNMKYVLQSTYANMLVYSSRFAPQTHLLTSATSDGQIALWDSQSEASLGILRQADGQQATDIVFDPSEEFAAILLETQLTEIWDMATRQRLATLDYFNNPITDVEIDPTGQLLAFTTSVKPYLEVWEIGDLQKLFYWQSREWFDVGGIAFYIAQDSRLPILNMVANEQLFSCHDCYPSLKTSGLSLSEEWNDAYYPFSLVSSYGEDIRDIVASPDGRLTAIAQSRYYEGAATLIILDAFNDEITRLELTDTFRLLGFDESATQVVFNQYDKANLEYDIQAFDLKTNQVRTLIETKGNIVISSDLSLAVVGTDIYKASTGEIIATLTEDSEETFVSQVNFNQDGRLLFAGMWYRKAPTSITVWDTQTLSQLAVIQAHMAAITDMAITQDGNLLVTGSQDGTVRLWGVPE